MITYVRDLVSGLKVKISQSTCNEKIKLLTLLPQSWTLDKVVMEFGVSHYRALKYMSIVKPSVTDYVLQRLFQELGAIINSCLLLMA